MTKVGQQTEIQLFMSQFLCSILNQKSKNLLSHPELCISPFPSAHSYGLFCYTSADVPSVEEGSSLWRRGGGGGGVVVVQVRFSVRNWEPGLRCQLQGSLVHFEGLVRVKSDTVSRVRVEELV